MAGVNQEGGAAVLEARMFRPGSPAAGGAGLTGLPALGPASASGAGRPRRSAAVWLGAELRRLRLEAGISQRTLTRRIGLSAHSNLGEYERGSRVPPSDIVEACERLLDAPPGYLQRLHRQALRERARAGGWAGSAPGGGAGQRPAAEQPGPP